MNHILIHISTEPGAFHKQGKNAITELPTSVESSLLSSNSEGHSLGKALLAKSELSQRRGQ